ncbi:MAG: sugar phosphate isomerase/epimerase family protein [SAR202 cluster bacterium]|nr:sugar phosphate isomerase/epimerase family protein [SAR202 cluster bacterium]
MKLCYAFRRGTFYPFAAEEGWNIPTGPEKARFLAHVADIGFDGIELGVESFGGIETTQAQANELQSELRDAGVPCVAIRAGGGLSQPNVAAQNRARLEKAIEIAGWIGAEIVNTALGTPPRTQALDSGANGAPTSHGSSQTATENDFIRTAAILHEAGEKAGAVGVDVTIEVHQHSIADNSWSTIHLLDLADSPHVFANPDLGNVYWTYDIPEETSEQSIVALAPRSQYWHCKSLYRVHIPEIEHTYYVRVPLPDGDIDYRFAISAMKEAGYDGYLAIEGANTGDQLHKDRRSVEYVKGLLSEME